MNDLTTHSSISQLINWFVRSCINQLSKIRQSIYQKRDVAFSTGFSTIGFRISSSAMMSTVDLAEFCALYFFHMDFVELQCNLSELFWCYFRTCQSLLSRQYEKTKHELTTYHLLATTYRHHAHLAPMAKIGEHDLSDVWSLFGLFVWKMCFNNRFRSSGE